MPKLADTKAPVVFANAQPKKKPYLIADGKGLSLLVTPEGSKRWVFRYRLDGKERKIAIKGGYPSVSLKVAREAATRFREILDGGEDPRTVRKTGKLEVLRQEAEVRKEETKAATTFEKVAREWHQRASDHLAPGNAVQTLQRLEKNIFPWIGDKPISDLRPPDFLTPLRLVEERGARESAHRIRGVCSQICRFAVASGVLESDPTRDLRGALAKPVEKHFAA